MTEKPDHSQLENLGIKVVSEGEGMAVVYLVSEQAAQAVRSSLRSADASSRGSAPGRPRLPMTAEDDGQGC